MQPDRDWRWRWGAALCCGALLRVLFLAFHPRFVGDTLIYGDLAHNLLTHHVYGLTEEGHVRATLIRLPGYPLFLALHFLLFGTGNYLAIIAVQCGMDLCTCLMVAVLARRLFGRAAGNRAIWIAALCPFTANYAAAALTETPSIFCVTLGLFALERWLTAVRAGFRGLRWAVCLGFAISAAVLLRPDGILLAGALLPAMSWAGVRAFRVERRQMRFLAGVLVSAGILAACLGTWTLRNWRAYHVIEVLAPKYANDPGEPAPEGFARWYRTWGTGLGDTARVYWEYDGSVLSLADLPSWAFDSPQQRAETAAIYDRYNAESSSTPASEADFDRLARERIRAHPVRSYVLMPLARLGDMWTRPRTELFGRHMPLDWWNLAARPRASLFAYAYGTLNLLLLVLAGVGLTRWRRRGWAPLAPFAAAALGYVVLRSALLMTIDNSEPRYVLEAYPVVFLLAALALTTRAVRSRNAPGAPVADDVLTGSVKG